MKVSKHTQPRRREAAPKTTPALTGRRLGTTPDPVDIERRKRDAAKLFGKDAAPSGEPLADRLDDVQSAPTQRIYLSTVAATPEISTVIASLYLAKRVLVVGHVPPDLDCVGSALGLTRALRALGKTADVVVDGELSVSQRAIDDQNDVKRASAVDPRDYDVVVLVDVAEAARIGGAAAFLKDADSVVVLDHHQVTPNKAGLGMGEDTALHSWVDPRADSASLLVSSVVEILAQDPAVDPFTRKTWKQIARPLAAGAWKDTEGFTLPGASTDGMAFFKHLVDEHLGGDVDALERDIEDHLPDKAMRVLARVREKEDGALGMMKVPRNVIDIALAAARETDPRITEADVLGQLFERLNAMRDRNPLAVMLLELPDDKVKVCTRSQAEGPALTLAQALGGGGHLQMAAAVTTGTLSDVETSVRGVIQISAGASRRTP